MMTIDSGDRAQSIRVQTRGFRCADDAVDARRTPELGVG